MDGNKTFRVFNKCNFDVGITLMSGVQPIIRKGSFLSLTVNDILYLESIATVRKPFSSNMFEIRGDDDKIRTLEDIGGYTDTFSEKHYIKDEIISNLKKPVKQVEKWIEGITDPVELHGIFEVATEMDLPNSKMKVLREKAPNSDVFNE